MIYKSFTELPVWQKAHNLAVNVFKLTTGLPRSEDYGLTSQIRKSSNGAPACIAEGFGRSTKKDKSNFYIIARGSAFECAAIFDYLNDIDQIDKDTFNQFYFALEEISKMLFALIKGLS
jgi:four helix bundle protein